MGGPIDMVQKGYELSIHDHDINYCVTMVGWVDVPGSEGVTSDVGMLSTYIFIHDPIRRFGQYTPNQVNWNHSWPVDVQRHPMSKKILAVSQRLANR